MKKLGVMRYLPIASPVFVEKYFGDGLNATAFDHAPLLIFNRREALQTRFTRSVTPATLAPPIHYVPSSTPALKQRRMDSDWRWLAPPCFHASLASGAVQTLGPGHWFDVPMYWQHWTIRSPALARLTEALLHAAASGLFIAPNAQQRR